MGSAVAGVERSGVEWVQGVLKQLRARKVVMFIDACRSEPVKGAGSRGGAGG